LDFDHAIERRARHGVCTCVTNVSVSTMPLHHRSFNSAPRWRAAVSLALSIAFHAMLFIVFLWPAAPAGSPGRFDVVTVYLRDSRRLSPPPAPEPRIAHVPSRPDEARRDIANTPRPLGSTPPTMPVRPPTPGTRDDAIPDKPARATDRVLVTISRTADTPLSKPSRVDEQANRANDSSALYARELAARLSQVKHYPQLAVALHEEGTVLLSFRLDRDGRLLAWKIASSSGHDDLDSEVERMIAEAAPFPPFPPSWQQPEKVFRVPIGFYLH
jgi:protein TonB